jgi:diguanylate cyclase (GGDEF)-like protein
MSPLLKARPQKAVEAAERDRTIEPVKKPADLTHDELVREYERLARGMDGMRYAFGRARKQSRTRFDKALIDPLTGLYNKGYFNQRLMEDVSQAWRHHRPIAVVYIDGDKFKNVNDTHGHPIGDRTIKLLANTIKASIRGSDAAFRLGGEEFAIVLSDASLMDAAAFAERLRGNVAATPFVFDGLDVDATQPGGKFTISVGATSYPDDLNVYLTRAHLKDQMAEYYAKIAKVLAKTADDALYDAKVVRNCVRTRTYGKAWK